MCCGRPVAQDVGAHQLERLVELLTPRDCEELLRTLSHPEENIFLHIEKLSPENNQLHTRSRAKRAAASSAASNTDFFQSLYIKIQNKLNSNFYCGCTFVAPGGPAQFIAVGLL